MATDQQRARSRMRPRRRRWEGIVDVAGVGVAVWCTAPDEARAASVLERVADPGAGPVRLVVMREQVYW